MIQLWPIKRSFWVVFQNEKNKTIKGTDSVGMWPLALHLSLSFYLKAKKKKKIGVDQSSQNHKHLH